MAKPNYNGESKIIKRLCEWSNVTDIQIYNSSVVDSEGIAKLDVVYNIQEEVDLIIAYLGLDLFYKNQNDSIYTDQFGRRYTNT